MYKLYDMKYRYHGPLSGDKIYWNTTSLAHKIYVQILKMEVVMDRVVDTRLELYNTSWLHSLETFDLYTWYRKPNFQVSLR